MTDPTQNTDKLLDKRTIDRRLARGTLSRDSFDSHLNSLPDLAGETENIAEAVYGNLFPVTETEAEPAAAAPVGNTVSYTHLTLPTILRV